MPLHATPAASLPFLDPDLPLARRVDDLVARLTLPEKINQLLHENNAVERLGVPAYNWWNEACHGVGRNGRATIFPQVIGLAATWDRGLVKRVAGVMPHRVVDLLELVQVDQQQRELATVLLAFLHRSTELNVEA